MNNQWHTSISGHFSSKEDILAYLNTLDGNWRFEHLTLSHPDSENNTIAFHRLSTCMEGCGCTGFSPKNNCPDPTCFCNKDKP